MTTSALARRHAELRETTPRFAKRLVIDHESIPEAAHEALIDALKEALDGWGYDYRMSEGEL